MGFENCIESSKHKLELKQINNLTKLCYCNVYRTVTLPPTPDEALALGGTPPRNHRSQVLGTTLAKSRRQQREGVQAATAGPAPWSSNVSLICNYTIF